MSSVRELICVPSAIPAMEQQGHFALAQEIFHGRAKERIDLADGYAIRVD